MVEHSECASGGQTSEFYVRGRPGLVCSFSGEANPGFVTTGRGPDPARCRFWHFQKLGCHATVQHRSLLSSLRRGNQLGAFMRWQVGGAHPRPPKTKDGPILSRATITQHCIIHMDVDNTRRTPPPLAPPATSTTDVTPSKIAGTSAHSEFREGSGYAHTSPMAILDPCSPTLHVRT